MITRKVDKGDALAGFTYGWVKRMGEELIYEGNYAQDSKLIVICMEKGDISDLPDNVEIFSLGKEIGVNRIGRFLEFQKLAFRLVGSIDGIFCHMNPEYTINIWPYAKMHNKKIVSWYTHGGVGWKVRLLEKLTNVVITASEESFRIKSNKKVVTGHGIDCDLFHPLENPTTEINTLKILTVGRISPTKDIESLIKAINVLKNNGYKNLKVEIVGAPPLSNHYGYFESLKQMARKMDLENIIHFVGQVPNKEVVTYYQNADLFINLSGTGSIDKAVLEAMACQCLVLTSNIAFKSILPSQFIVEKNNPAKLAERVLWILSLSVVERKILKKKLREEVVINHNLNTLIKKIVNIFKV